MRRIVLFVVQQDNHRICFDTTWRYEMKTIATIITTSMLIGSSFVYAGQGPAGVDATGVAPTPQLMEQTMQGQPDIAADGINNASQVDDPTDIGRSGSVTEFAPDPQLLEGGSGSQEAR
jgi:hypothetical protein